MVPPSGKAPRGMGETMGRDSPPPPIWLKSDLDQHRSRLAQPAAAGSLPQSVPVADDDAGAAMGSCIAPRNSDTTHGRAVVDHYADPEIRAMQAQIVALQKRIRDRVDSNAAEASASGKVGAAQTEEDATRCARQSR